MKANKTLRHIEYFLVLAVAMFFFNCRPKEATFTLSDDVIEVPFVIGDNTSRYYTQVVVAGDTMHTMIDTGASFSSLYNHASAKQTGVTTRAIDSQMTVRELSLVRFPILQWGGLTVENILIGLRQGEKDAIIGSDILKHFCVKFDNENNKILFSKDATLIPKRGLKVPISLDKYDRPCLDLTINNMQAKFLFDTGASEELLIDSILYHQGRLDNKNIESQWSGRIFESYFTPDSLTHDELHYFGMANCGLENKIFKNVLTTYTPTYKQNNGIGAAFMRRFKSVTIDYIHKEIYMELPDDMPEIAENVSLNFSDREITDVPTVYLTTLYRYYLTFGFIPSWRAPFVVSNIEINSENTSSITIGDTLIGINGTLFSQSAFERINRKSNYRIESDKNMQRKLVVSTMTQDTVAIFHFAKGDSIITEKRKRKKSTNSFSFGYSFKTELFPFYAHHMTFFMGENTKMHLQFPWSTLSGFVVVGDTKGDNGKIINVNNIPTP